MTDLVIGAYILGLLKGYARTIPHGGLAIEESTREILRVLGPRWARRVRCQILQCDGPLAYHLTFRQELSIMCSRGARDGRYLAAKDPLCFAKAGSLLASSLR